MDGVFPLHDSSDSERETQLFNISNKSHSSLRSKRGSTIHRRTRERIIEMVESMQKEETSLVKRARQKVIKNTVCENFSISEKTYYRIMKEREDHETSGKQIQTPGINFMFVSITVKINPHGYKQVQVYYFNKDHVVIFSNSGKKRPRPNYAQDRMDNFARDALRRHIHRMYCEGVFPTLQKMCKFATEELEYNGSLTSLYRILIDHMGFRCKKVNGRKMLIERHDVVLLRFKYLRQWFSFVNENRTFVFLDETWIWEHHHPSKCWQSENEVGIKAPIGHGRRLILLHAGGTQGFINNSLLLFISKSGQEDYHEDMNSVIFESWFNDKLLPNIPANSVIVMDNATYHSVQINKAPNSSSRKQTMFEWLTENKIQASMEMRKVELYDLVLKHKPEHVKYVIEETAKSHGHVVLRTPPYMCEFNPIELIWAQLKTEVGKRNTTFKINDVKKHHKRSGQDNNTRDLA